MKVLFVISGNSFSGAERVLFSFLKNVQEFEFGFLLLQYNKDIVEYIQKHFHGKEIIIFNVPLKINRVVRFFTASIYANIYKRKILGSFIWNKLTNFEPDILYLNNSIETAFFPFEKLKIPVISHIHDMVSMFRPSFRNLLLQKLKHATKILTVSKASKKDLEKFGIPSQKIVVVYNNVPQDIINLNDENNSIIKKDFRQTNSKIVIGFIGGLIKRKGFDILLKSACIISKKTNLDLVIKIAYHEVDEKYMSFCKKILKFCNNIKVEFFKSLPREKIKDFYNEVDIIVVPSRRDPLPTTVLESIALNKITIATNVDGIPEIIPDSTFLFKKNDPHSLAEKLLLINNISEEILSEKMKFLKKHLKENFSEKAKKEKIIEIINQIFKA